MKKFKFTLEKLLEVKETLERAAEDKLAEGLHGLNGAKEELQRLHRQLNEQVNKFESIEDNKSQGQSLSIHLAYLDRIQRQIRLQTQVTHEKESIVTTLSNRLRDLMKERESLERLKEHEHNHWIRAYKHMEQEQMDDSGRSQFFKKTETDSYVE